MTKAIPTISITIEELIIYKMGLHETLNILHPGQLKFVSAYENGYDIGAHFNPHHGSITVSFRIK